MTMAAALARNEGELYLDEYNGLDKSRGRAQAMPLSHTRPPGLALSWQRKARPKGCKFQDTSEGSPGRRRSFAPSERNVLDSPLYERPLPSPPAPASLVRKG